MSSIRKLFSTTIVSTLIAIPIAVNAHHSMSEFNRTVIEEVEGVVGYVECIGHAP